MPRTAILAYCMPWHLNQSDAFQHLLTKPLADHLSFSFSSQIPPVPGPVDLAIPVVFCQIMPPIGWWHRHPRMVWIPMWDAECQRPLESLYSLPKTIRVVAFSRAIAKRADAAGLQCLRLRFFPKPADIILAREDYQKKVLFYWNRTGLCSPSYLERICKTLEIDQLLFREQIDPAIDERLHYRLPAKIGSTSIVSFPMYPTQQEYLNAVHAANFMIAPRAVEGVGLTMLEAMSRGAVVIAANAPTMNEYIRNGENGILFELASPDVRQRFLRNEIYRRAAKRIGLLRPDPRFGFNGNQKLDSLLHCDFFQMGRRALEDVKIGHQQWVNMLPEYARFISNW